MTEEQIQRAVQIYNTGKGIDAVAREMKIGRALVYKALHEKGSVRNRISALKLLRKEIKDKPKVIQSYNEGDSLSTLSRQYKVDAREIRRVLTEAGIKIRTSYEQRQKKGVRDVQQDRI